MHFNQFVDWAFLGIIGGSLSWCVGFLSKISKSVSELNTKLAVVLERVDFHSKALDTQDKRISHLEKKR